jgi:hypothetical protein
MSGTKWLPRHISSKLDGSSHGLRRHCTVSSRLPVVQFQIDTCRFLAWLFFGGDSANDEQKLHREFQEHNVAHLAQIAHQMGYKSLSELRESDLRELIKAVC